MQIMRWAAPSILLLAACQSISSSNVTTQGIYADLSATSDGSSTHVEARLKTGGQVSNTYLDLQNGDSLTAYAGSDTSPMSKNTLLGEVWYTSNFMASTTNMLVRVDFERAHDAHTMECLGGSAPNSLATVPDAFEISAPTQNASVSRKSGAIQIAWSPSGSTDHMEYSVNGSCIEPMLSQLISNDSGTLTIPAGSLKDAPNPTMQGSTSCTITVEITRQRAGKIDPAYGEGGTFSAAQVRQIAIQSTP
jgi:hypothetical protein